MHFKSLHFHFISFRWILSAISPEIQEWSHKSRSRINNLYLLTRPIGRRRRRRRRVAWIMIEYSAQLYYRPMSSMWILGRPECLYLHCLLFSLDLFINVQCALNNFAIDSDNRQWVKQNIRHEVKLLMMNSLKPFYRRHVSICIIKRELSAEPMAIEATCQLGLLFSVNLQTG